MRNSGRVDNEAKDPKVTNRSNANVKSRQFNTNSSYVIEELDLGKIWADTSILNTPVFGRIFKMSLDSDPIPPRDPSRPRAPTADNRKTLYHCFADEFTEMQKQLSLKRNREVAAIEGYGPGTRPVRPTRDRCNSTLVFQVERQPLVDPVPQVGVRGDPESLEQRQHGRDAGRRPLQGIRSGGGGW